MKQRFSFSLSGKDWWKPFLLFWLLYLLAQIPMQALSRNPALRLGSQLGSLAVNLLFSFLSMIVEAAFAIVFARLLLPKVSVKGKAFAFDGKVGEYLGLNVGAFLLTVITLGVYAPWYQRKVAAYLVSHAECGGARPEFLGKGGTLFKYFLLALGVPLLLILLPLAIWAASHRGAGYGAWPKESVQLVSTLVTFVLVFVLLAPLSYFLWRWYVNLKWGEIVITLKAKFWPAVGFIVGQLALTLVTLSIYWPLAYVKILAYFAGKISFDREAAPAGTEIGRLGFDLSGSRYFGLFWGQTLLSVLTLGIYLPWALAKLTTWVFDRLYYEEKVEVGGAT